MRAWKICRTAAGVMVLLGTLVRVVPAELAPAEDRQARALIAQFTDRRFEVRQQAVQSLVRMGPDVLPLLRQTLAGTTDQEVKLRCRMAIDQIPAAPAFEEKRVKRMAEFPETGGWYATLSPDATRLAFKANFDRETRVMVDGKLDPPLDGGTGRLIFSPDSKRLAYTVHRREEVVVVCDGKPGPSLPDGSAPEPIFSPDSRRLGYWVRWGGRWEKGKYVDGKYFIVVDDEKSPVYDYAWIPHFSPDSKRTAWAAGRGGREFVVVDGREGPPYDAVRWVRFAPDSKGVVYWASRGGRWFMVSDGVEQEKDGYFRTSGWPIFSPDGRHLAYAAAHSNVSYELVRDGTRSQTYEYVGAITFSPDSRRTAFYIHTGRRYAVVVDDVQERFYDNVNYQLKFSPDGRHLAYPARVGIEWRMVCDGRESPPGGEMFTGAFEPIFSPDSRNLAWKVKVAKQWAMVLNGASGPLHEEVLVPEAYAATPGKFRYAVRDNREVWLVEVDWPESLGWSAGLVPPK